MLSASPALAGFSSIKNSDSMLRLNCMKKLPDYGNSIPKQPIEKPNYQLF